MGKVGGAEGTPAGFLMLVVCGCRSLPEQGSIDDLSPRADGALLGGDLPAMPTSSVGLGYWRAACPKGEGEGERRCWGRGGCPHAEACWRS